ncbi:DUF441 family protein, partial [Salmonella enterica subsp. enterica serovar Cerro]|nr:DUF441 family protein [Salmonella enterica subsp. enterica serovar Cerro]
GLTVGIIILTIGVMAPIASGTLPPSTLIHSFVNWKSLVAIAVVLDQLRRTLNAAWVHMADKHAETANMAGIMRCAFLYPALLGLV